MYEILSKQDKKKSIQKKEAKKPANRTGIADGLKSTYEQRSGFSFDDVKVHYHSKKPAQLKALAYTQGSQVYIGPGQERHLEHELGHVIQQKQGIVKATGSIRGIPVNEDAGLERDAERINIAGRADFTPEQESVAQMQGIPCIQFEKQDIVTRIMALLNLNSQNPDRNNALYLVLNIKIISHERADKLSTSDPRTFLLELSEEELLAAEKAIAADHTHRDFIHVYGPTDKVDESNCFSVGFKANHFGNSFDEAFTISKNRFAGSAIPASTVLMNFQMDNFMVNEYFSISNAAAAIPFSTDKSYYFWQFTRDAAEPFATAAAVPAAHALRQLTNAKVSLSVNVEKKVFHLDGTAGVPVVMPVVNEEDAFKKMNNACRKAKTISEKLDIPILSEIFHYIETVEGMLGAAAKSEMAVTRVFGRVMTNFFSALAASDYDTFYNGQTETGNGHSFDNSSYFQNIFNDLNTLNLMTYFTIRECKALYDEMIEKCQEVNDKYL